MYIKEMRVFGFKRFSKLQVELSPGINIVVGDNDAGKSTLLEVITAVLDGQYRGTSLARNLSEDYHKLSTKASDKSSSAISFIDQILLFTLINGVANPSLPGAIRSLRSIV